MTEQDTVGDTLTEMLTRVILGAPPHLIANAADNFRRIVENERRRAIGECKSALIAAGVEWAADILNERVRS